MGKTTRFAPSFEPLQIFQDELLESNVPMNSHAPMPNVTKPPRRPLSSSNSNIIMNQPGAPNAGLSPNKSKVTSTTAALTKSHGNKLNMVPMAPPMTTTKPNVTDSLQKKPPLSKFKTNQQKAPAPDSSVADKENIYPAAFASVTFDPAIIYYEKPNGKRGLMEAAPIKQARPLKKAKTDEEEPFELPPHDSFPPIIDDGGKPPHSYAQLISMAILRSPERRLTLSAIYKWISDNYKYYHPGDAGWQNSIRHNLSLHKSFIKIERAKENPGKGSYWAIAPGTEMQFLKDKPARKPVPTVENVPVMSTRLEVPPPGQIPNQNTFLLEQPLMDSIPMGFQEIRLPPLPNSQAPFSLPLEPSSDATIPASDVQALENAAYQGLSSEFEVLDGFYSPLPPPVVHSSPPVSRSEPRHGTPPSLSHNPTPPAPRSLKRSYDSVDDSGYISSIESSAMRPNQKPHLLTSEADRPRIKRGRAEEEIARIRNSSPFSPTHNRSISGYGPISSSPLRQVHDTQMPPPLTPVVKMKPPQRPPPSASPNTNLRRHREQVRSLLQSPNIQGLGVEGIERTHYSPSFRLDDAFSAYQSTLESTPGGFQIYQDPTGLDESIFTGGPGGPGSVETGSPVKRSVKRARLDRSASTSALSEMPSSTSNRPLAAAPLLKAPGTPSQFFDTPSKAFADLNSPSIVFQQSPTRNALSSSFALLDEPWQHMTFNNILYDSQTQQSAADLNGLDITLGFNRIGDKAHTDQNPRPKRQLGRSYSTGI